MTLLRPCFGKEPLEPEMGNSSVGKRHLTRGYALSRNTLGFLILYSEHRMTPI